MRQEPSKYQKAIYKAFQLTKRDISISAVAGSGKTTVLLELLKYIPSNSNSLFLAFNNSIVDELRERNKRADVQIMTIHSCGWRSILCRYGSKVKMNPNKSIAKTEKVIKELNISENKRGYYFYIIPKILDLMRCNLCENNEKEIMDLILHYDINVDKEDIKIAQKAFSYLITDKSQFDFMDMIYVPVTDVSVRLQKYDYVFCDESQDFSVCQQLFIKMSLSRKGRLVTVGDRNQAIYGFAGADVESFNLLGTIPHTVKLPLSVCYRCDADIISLAKELVPQIEARDNAPAGIVNNNSVIADVKDGDMVLCRVTAPLVSLCMRYIAQGVKAYVKGRDIGKNLINLIKKTNKKKMTDVMEKLNRELGRIIGKVVAKTHCTEQEARESEAYRSYEDKLKVIEILSEGLDNAQDVMDRIDMIFSDDSKNGICLSTVHKSKGLESDRVFILCPDKFYLKACMRVSWMAEQERNLVYVAYTRAKHFLGFITDFTA